MMNRTSIRKKYSAAILSAVFVLGLSMVSLLHLRANDDAIEATISRGTPNVDLRNTEQDFKKVTSVENSKFGRKATVKCEGPEKIKRAELVDDPGSTWEIPEIAADGSFVTYSGIQKEGIEAKRYEPVFSGIAGRKRDGGGGGGEKAPPEDFEWNVTASYLVVELDVDVDSDNNGGVYGGPDRSDEEDEIEEDYPGKFIPVNDGTDNNGVPGFAQFSNVPTNSNTNSTGTRFVPFVVEIKTDDEVEIDLTGATISFSYSASVPNIPLKRGGKDSPYYEPASGHLRIWTKDYSASRNPKSVAAGGDWIPKTKVDAKKIFGDGKKVTLYLEGIRPGKDMINVELTLPKHGNVTVVDKIAVTVVHVDLDVDSDNNGTIDSTPFNHEDQTEDIKDKPKYPGKYIAVNNADVNNDGIPNFADGFKGKNFDNSKADAGGSFTEMKLTIPAPVDMSKVLIRFDYSASDPAETTRSGAGTPEDPYVYTPANGYIRVWKVDGMVSRNSACASTSGHYVKPGVAYTAKDLGFTIGARAKTLYIEGIRPSDTAADQQIKVEMDPDGGGPAEWVHADAVRVTVVGVDLDIDSDYDGDIDDDDDPLEMSAGGIVGLNQDDDNNNGIPDKDETGTVAGENDLRPITLKLKPSAIDVGTLTLSAEAGATRIKVWESSTKGTQVVLPKTWTIGTDTVPETLYVEGVEASAALRDVVLRLLYASGGNELDDKIALTVIKVDIDKIAFNYKPTSATDDALSIRDNYLTAITVPEYHKGGQNKPAAYIKDTAVKIMVHLKVKPETITSLKIKGVSDDTNGSLGDATEKTVTFSGGISQEGTDDASTRGIDESKYVEFTINGNTPNKIFKSVEAWNWTVTAVNGSAVSDMEVDRTTGHVVYTVLNTPQSPWNQTVDDPATLDDDEGNLNPWVSALEFAITTCNANGKDTDDKVMEAITTHLYTVPYPYGPIPPKGSAQCWSWDAVDGETFNYSHYMTTALANCWDSALGLDATGSLLGMDLVAIKKTDWFDGWVFHAFVKKGDFAYDSCSAMPQVYIKWDYATYTALGNPQPTSVESVLSFPIK